MLKRDIDTKLAAGAIAMIVLVVAAVYFFFFSTPSEPISGKAAGAGEPTRPGELPPGVTPPPDLPYAPPGGSQTR